MKNIFNPFRSKNIFNVIGYAVSCIMILFLHTLKVGAQTLNTGDFAVIGMNTSFNINTTAPIGPDEFAIVALAAIPSGATFQITDRGWNGSAMITTNTGDGVMSWTTTSLIPAGTAFKLTINAGTTPAVTISPNTFGTPTITAGWTSTSIPGAMANVGDQVIIYQGSDTNPSNFVYGFNTSNSTATAAGNWQVGSTSARDSDLPTGLTNNAAVDGTVASTALAFTNNSGGYFANNFVYVGPKTGTKTDLLMAIATRANWMYTTTLTTTYDLNIGGANFSGSNPIFSFPLPVSMLNFEGVRRIHESIELHWQTVSETNNKGFEIQQSTDAENFTTIAYVEGKVNSSVISYYQVAVNHSAAVHYRLKQVDLDGKFSYSRIVYLEGINGKITISPNPVKDRIELVGEDQNDYQVCLSDIAGNSVENFSGTLSQIENDLNRSLVQYRAGVYLLKFMREGEWHIQRFIKAD